jgi:hypothetical protein
MKSVSYISFLASLILAGTSLGSTTSNATIAELAIYRPYGNIVFVRLSAGPASPPSCATQGYWHYALALDGIAGKEMYAMLLSAQAAGKQVAAIGTATCSDFASVESLQGANVVN